MSNRECFQKSNEVLCRKIDVITKEIAESKDKALNVEADNQEFVSKLISDMYNLCAIKVGLYDSTMSELYNLQSLLVRVYIDESDKEEADKKRAIVRDYSKKLVKEAGKLSDANDYLMEISEKLKMHYGNYNRAVERKEELDFLQLMYANFLSSWNMFDSYDDEVHAFFKNTLDPLKKEIYQYIDDEEAKNSEPGANE